MSKIKQAIASQSSNYNKWYKKNSWILKLLGLSWNEAAFQRGKVDGVVADIQSFKNSAKKFLAVILIVLALLCLTHSFLFLSTTRIFNLISIYFGLIGSFLASYGFILGFKKTKPKHQANTIWMPDIPNRTEEYPRYCEKMNEIVANIINSDANETFEQLKLELRKQFSLIIGFGLLVISFCIQIVLEFVGR